MATIKQFRRRGRWSLIIGTILAAESIRECWETFELFGWIRRQEVLDPGRCSAFMFALFRQVPGVVEQVGDDPYLVFSA